MKSSLNRTLSLCSEPANTRNIHQTRKDHVVPVALAYSGQSGMEPAILKVGKTVEKNATFELCNDFGK